MCCTTPGIETTGSGSSMPSFTKSGATRSSTSSRGLGDQPAQRGRAAEPAGALLGERHDAPGYRIEVVDRLARSRDERGEERGDEAVDRVRVGLGVDREPAAAAVVAT